MKEICQNSDQCIGTLQVLHSSCCEQGGVRIEYRLYQAELGALCYIMEIALDGDRKCVVLDADRAHALQICEKLAKAAVTPCTVRDILKEMEDVERKIP